jgi:DnaK suppressor protein
MSNITKNQMDELQKTMQAELAQLLIETQDEMNPALKTNFIDIDGDVADDERVADVIVDTDNAIIGMHLQEINDLNAALDRIQSGFYGDCIDCGDDITYERLSAYPTAKRCIRCQQQHERMFVNETKYSF